MQTLGVVMENDTAPAQPLEILETPQSLARKIRTTPQTINNWHRSGIIPSRIAVGRVIRFDLAEVLAALSAQSTTGRERA
jgi:hypothetical protein